MSINADASNHLKQEVRMLSGAWVPTDNLWLCKQMINHDFVSEKNSDPILIGSFHWRGTCLSDDSSRANRNRPSIRNHLKGCDIGGGCRLFQQFSWFIVRFFAQGETSVMNGDGLTAL
mmetsp:Transcript_33114/g.68962  ORF Transcript_33114/g.68962 Transcript_33114/m.68962 type:complete len:118 (+) Transcript_33114:120-473(+)